MKLRLKENKVNRLTFVDADGHKVESGFTLRFKPTFYEDDAKKFAVSFDFVYVTDDDRSLNIDYISIFETDLDIDDAFKASKFPVVNAPAIAFPFLRAFIANFLMSSGYKPILLPAFNFTKFEQAVDALPE